MIHEEEALIRWRLILGRFAENQIAPSMSPKQQAAERALDFLYSREYRARGVRESAGSTTDQGTTVTKPATGPSMAAAHAGGSGSQQAAGFVEAQRGGGLSATQLSVPEWINHVRELFPQETVAVIEKHALNRYGLMELISDAEVLKKLEPSLDLVKTLLTFRNHIRHDVLDEVRAIIRKVVKDLQTRLTVEVRRMFSARKRRFRHTSVPMAQNFDWRGTIRRNLKNFDSSRKQLVVEQPLFFARTQRRLPWRVILCVDQSQSMTGSVVHAAVMAGILTGLPSLDVKLVVFDTSVVELSGCVDDPVEVLMKVQLGGGTDIGKAMRYCEQLVDDPHHTAVVLISDFEEGANPDVLIACCRRFREGGTKLLGLAALDERANAAYNIRMAERLAETGMDIACLTPRYFAEWLVQTIS